MHVQYKAPVLLPLEFSFWLSSPSSHRDCTSRPGALHTWDTGAKGLFSGAHGHAPPWSREGLWGPSCSCMWDWGAQDGAVVSRLCWQVEAMPQARSDGQGELWGCPEEAGACQALDKAWQQALGFPFIFIKYKGAAVKLAAG